MVNGPAVGHLTVLGHTLHRAVQVVREVADEASALGVAEGAVCRACDGCASTFGGAGVEGEASFTKLGALTNLAAHNLTGVFFEECDAGSTEELGLDVAWFGHITEMAIRGAKSTVGALIALIDRAASIRLQRVAVCT